MHCVLAALLLCALLPGAMSSDLISAVVNQLVGDVEQYFAAGDSTTEMSLMKSVTTTTGVAE